MPQIAMTGETKKAFILVDLYRRVVKRQWTLHKTTPLKIRLVQTTFYGWIRYGKSPLLRVTTTQR